MSPQVIAQVGPDDIHLIAAQYRFLTGQEVIQNKPTLTAISPTTKVAGAATFTLTATGTNFVTGLSKIFWGADPVATTFVSATSLTASIDAAKVAAVGVVPVTVVTGSLQSQSINFEITAAELFVAAAESAVEPGVGEELPDDTWLKADIIAWIETSDIDTTGLTLTSLTKAELLTLIGV